MRYLDFSSPKSVMTSIFFEVFISLRGVCVRACLYVCEGGGSGDSDCAVECW